jgi:hypothetical protein
MPRVTKNVFPRLILYRMEGATETGGEGWSSLMCNPSLEHVDIDASRGFTLSRLIDEIRTLLVHVK